MKKALGFMVAGAAIAGIGMAIRDLIRDGVFEELDCYDCCGCCDDCDCCGCCDDDCKDCEDCEDCCACCPGNNGDGVCDGRCSEEFDETDDMLTHAAENAEKAEKSE